MPDTKKQANTNTPQTIETTKPVIFSGMQPSSDSLHLGNYVGALRNWVTMQNECEAVFCVVNLHAITVPQDPAELRARTRKTAAQYIAAGINPNRATLFVQSQVPAHTELAWLLNNIAGFGEASRMTQFKDKSKRFAGDSISVGLFTYPMLMAADILLYNATAVPVGEDQRQHVELTRDLAIRFNTRYGKTFVVPEARIEKGGAKIYDLQNPETKMSKSQASEAGLIKLLDEEHVTAKKIMRAVTDSSGEIRFDRKQKPGVSNLLTILHALNGKSITQLEHDFQGKGYGQLKKTVAETVEATCRPVRERTAELLQDPAELDRILAKAAETAHETADATVDRAYRAMGLIR